MRNPNRTTKPERRHIRRYNRYAVRVLGVAEAARWHREGILLDEAKGFENLVVAVLYGPVPDDLHDRVTAAYDAQRAGLERKLGVGPGMPKSTSSNVNNYSVHERKLDLTAAVNARLNGYGVNNAEVEVEPLGPSGCGHYEVVEMPADVHNLAPGEWQATVDATRRAPAVVTIPESLGGGTFTVPHRYGAHETAAMFGAFYQAYRKGRELGDAVEVPATPEFAPIDDIVGAAEVSTDYVAPVGGLEPEPLGRSACGHYEVSETPMRIDGLFIRELAEERAAAYVAWDGDPWRDPNEVAAVHAEAIENALNDDIEQGGQ